MKMMPKNHDPVDLLRPRLGVRHLGIMVALDHAGSVTRAADLLGITQPALSRQIRDAERRLGIALFTREKKRLRPTLAGECLLEHAKRILSDLAGAEADSVQIPAGPRDVVRIGSGAYACYRWLPGFLRELQEKAPQIDLTVVGEAMRLPLEGLAHDEVDVAIVPGPVERRGLRAVHLFDDELVAVLPPGHVLAGRPSLAASDLADQTYITYGPTYQTGFETARVLRPAKVWPKRLIKVDLSDAIIELVAAGFGISVLSRWAVSAAAEAGAVVTARVTESGLPIAWSAAVRRGDGPQAPALCLANELARWCRRDPRSFAVRQAGRRWA